jgi:C-terminal processing protease CtpA/Prc
VLDRCPFVYRDFSTDDHQLQGGEILSINGVSAKRILKAMMSIHTGEDRSMTAVSYRIGHYWNFNIDLYGLFKLESPFQVVYRNTHGERRLATITGKTFPELDALSAARDTRPSMMADLKFVDDGRLAVLTIRSFEQYVDQQRKLTIHDFLQRSFEQIRDRQSSSLIIDVRDNSGGLDAPGAQLFSYLWDQPFEYYKDKTINAREFDFYRYCPDAKPVPEYRVDKRADGKFHYHSDPGLGLQQPLQPHFGGKVFALMNGGSFSTTCEFLSMLPLHKRGVLIGEEAAGGFYGCTCGFRVMLTLPNSKVRVPLGMVTYYYAAADYKHAGRGMIPDYPVTHTINDLLAGRDRDMELAVSLARSK